MSKKFDLVIDGGKVSARDHFEVHNPSTGEVVGLAPQASPAALDHAVAAANKAFLSSAKKVQPKTPTFRSSGPDRSAFRP